MNVNDSAGIYHSGAGYDLEHSGSSHSFMDDANTTYEVVKIKLNWRDAADFAELRGGKLAEINGTAENNLVFNGILASGINLNNTRAPDGGGGAYLWLGGE